MLQPQTRNGHILIVINTSMARLIGIQLLIMIKTLVLKLLELIPRRLLRLLMLMILQLVSILLLMLGLHPLPILPPPLKLQPPSEPKKSPQTQKPRQKFLGQNLSPPMLMVIEFFAKAARLKILSKLHKPHLLLLILLILM